MWYLTCQGTRQKDSILLMRFDVADDIALLMTRQIDLPDDMTTHIAGNEFDNLVCIHQLNMRCNQVKSEPFQLNRLSLLIRSSPTDLITSRGSLAMHGPGFACVLDRPMAHHVQVTTRYGQLMHLTRRTGLHASTQKRKKSGGTCKLNLVIFLLCNPLHGDGTRLYFIHILMINGDFLHSIIRYKQ